jgi:hypothetical protein
MRLLTFTLLAAASLSAAPSQQTFSGTISDDVCARNGHAAMRMGPTDAECTKMCVLYHGSSYVLDAGKDVYMLSDQRTPANFAAQKVKVTGTLDAKTMTIQVTSIAAAK